MHIFSEIIYHMKHSYTSGNLMSREEGCKRDRGHYALGLQGMGATLPDGNRPCLNHVKTPNRLVFCPLDGASFPCDSSGYL